MHSKVSRNANPEASGASPPPRGEGMGVGGTAAVTRATPSRRYR